MFEMKAVNGTLPWPTRYTILDRSPSVFHVKEGVQIDAQEVMQKKQQLQTKNPMVIMIEIP